MIGIIQNNPLGVFFVGVLIFGGVLVWIHLQNKPSDSGSGASTNTDISGKRLKIKYLLLFGAGTLFLFFAKTPSLELGSGETELLPILKSTAIVLIVIALSVLGYKLFPVKKENQKNNVLQYTAFGAVIIAILLLIVYMVPWSTLFPTGKPVLSGAKQIGNTANLKALAPFVVFVPLAYLFAYYMSNEKRYKNKGYALTVAGVATIVVLCVTQPQFLSWVFDPFLDSDPIGKAVAATGNVDSTFLMVLFVIIGIGLFMTGHIVWSLITALALFVYLSKIYVLC